MTPVGSLQHWLRLTLIPGIGGETQRKLLAAFGLPEAVFSAGYNALRGVLGDKAVGLLLDADTEASVAAAVEWSQAVSYTHLDVYKRQRPECRTGPVSSPASICMMHTPVSPSPARIARWMGAAPRQRGSSEA